MNSQELFIKWRRINGLTLEEAAEMAEVSTTAIKSWESKRRVPRPKNLRKFAENLNITYEDFRLGPEEYYKQKNNIQLKGYILNDDLVKRLQEVAGPLRTEDIEIVKSLVTVFLNLPFGKQHAIIARAFAIRLEELKKNGDPPAGDDTEAIFD